MENCENANFWNPPVELPERDRAKTMLPLVPFHWESLTENDYSRACALQPPHYQCICGAEDMRAHKQQPQLITCKRQDEPQNKNFESHLFSFAYEIAAYARTTRAWRKIFCSPPPTHARTQCYKSGKFASQKISYRPNFPPWKLSSWELKFDWAEKKI